MRGGRQYAWRASVEPLHDQPRHRIGRVRPNHEGLILPPPRFVRRHSVACEVRDALSVGRPLVREHAFGRGGQRAWRSAGDRNREDLRSIAGEAHERHGRTVGAPAELGSRHRRIKDVYGVTQARRCSAARRHHEQRALVFVLRQRRRRHDVGHTLAVRGNPHVDDRSHLHLVVECERYGTRGLHSHAGPRRDGQHHCKNQW